MGRLGFEPKTNRLKAECSTAELATQSHARFQAPFSTIAEITKNVEGFSKKSDVELYGSLQTLSRSQFGEILSRI